MVYNYPFLESCHKYNTDDIEYKSNKLDLYEHIQESIVKNKLILSVKGIPITRSYHTSSLVSIIRDRSSYHYWNKSKGELFRKLLLPDDTNYRDSDLFWSNRRMEQKGHPSWFLVRTTKESTVQLNSLPQLSLSVNIVEEDDTVKQFLIEKNQKEMTRMKKSVNNTISHRLINKKSKKEQANMSLEELELYKDNQQRQKDEMYDSVYEEKKSVIRNRLFRLYGTKKQYEFLRQQRGVYRHVYNMCVSDYKYNCNTGKDIANFLYFLLESDEVELTTSEEQEIKENIEKHEQLEKTLIAKYQPDSYWKENSKEWGLTTPSNMRTSAIKNFFSNINVAHKTAKAGFSMSMLNKKVDKISFQLPISTQQINTKTGTTVPSTRHKNKKAPTKTKDVIFQYMSTRCPEQGKFTVRVKDKDKFPTTKSDINHDCKFIYKSNCWYVAIPYDVPIKTLETKSNLKICSIDPGIKTPYTVYDPHDGSITEIGTTKDSLGRIKNEKSILSTHAVLERIRRKCRRYQRRLDIDKAKAETHVDKIKIQNKIKKCIRRLMYKKKCFIDELHYKTISYLTSNYDVIMMPYFDTDKLVKSKKLSKKSKQALLDLNFSLFRQRLACKAESQGKVWLEVGEGYTTKDCVRCGTTNDITLKTRVFECSNCHLKMGRDVHSSISIFVKNTDINSLRNEEFV